MIRYSFVLSTLLAGILLLGLVGCGDDETTEKPTVEPTKPDPMVSNEALIGSWEVVSINDGPPLAFVNADEPDEEDRPKINIDNFYYNFAADSSWTLNLEFEMVDFPEDPHREDAEMAGKIDLTAVLSGYFGIQDSILSLTKNSFDVSISPTPEDFFQERLGVTETLAKQELVGKFNEHILTPFEKSSFTIEGEMLHLESNGSSKAKMVLKKR